MNGRVGSAKAKGATPTAERVPMFRTVFYLVSLVPLDTHPTVPVAFNRAPVLSSPVASWDTFTVAHETTITVEAVDPDGDTVTVRLLNQQSGFYYAPASGAGSARLTIDWSPRDTGTVRLVFEAPGS